MQRSRALWIPSSRSRLFLAAGLSLGLAFTGCKQSAPTTPASGPAATDQAAPKVDPATAGEVTGSVSFAGKPPARLAIDMSMDPVCSLTAEPNLTEQVVVTDHKLAGVYVYLKAGAPVASAPAGTAPVVLDQKGCRYVPHIVAVQQGGTVEFRNSDPTMHNIHTMPTTVGNQTVDISQGPNGAPQRQRFPAAESMIPVRCNNHPWMNAFVNVAPNQWFAVTGTDGSFRLPSLPPGTYTLAAVHETLGEQDQQITVGPKATVPVTFRFSAK